MLTLTPTAHTEILSLGGELFISLEAGGCCGMAYQFALVGQGEVHLRLGEVSLHLTAAAQAVLNGATLDYGSKLRPPRFRVLRNPNTPLRCACNRSFGSAFPGKKTPQCRAACPMPWLERKED